MNAIEVEFFGIARQRAQRASTMLEVDGGVSFVSVLQRLAEQCPELVPDCILAHGELGTVCSANLNGDRFLSDSESVIEPGDRLLIMSADAGG